VVTNSQDVSFVVPPNVAAAVNQGNDERKALPLRPKTTNKFYTTISKLCCEIPDLTDAWIITVHELVPMLHQIPQTHVLFMCLLYRVTNQSLYRNNLLTKTSFIACFPFASNKVKMVKYGP
jgi:hypothetical protein